MDKISLNGLAVECVVGAWEWERHIKQKVVLDIELTADIKRAAATDRLEDALDYAQISNRLVEFVSGSRFQLIDTLAERCAQLLLEEFRAAWVRVTVNKSPAGLPLKSVAVSIERSR